MADTIMIVDDSLTVRADLEETFSVEGLPTIACATLAQARAVFASESIALVILDVLLPDGDGIEFLKELRENPGGATLPVLMLSSEAEVKDRIHGLLTGSSDYIGKPYDRDHVLARVRELLGSQKLGSQKSTDNSGLAGEKAVVLVIDDSPTFRESFGELLREQGFEVLFAETGEDGLRSAAANRPTAIIVDGVLPGIDGPTVVRKLRLDAALRHIPCIMLTSSDSFEAELRALESGADTFVRKEENLDMILARTTAILRHAGKLEPRRDTASLQGPKRILAVDDSITYLQEINDILSDEGYDVILAQSGEEALEMLTVQAVDCILLDRLMPGIDGAETCRRIKAAPATRDIPLIMLTALEDRDAMIEGLSMGADDYVLKSSETDVLNARVRAQLRRKQFEEESRQIRKNMMNRELEAAEMRATRLLAESRMELLAALEQKNADLEKVVEQLRQSQQEIEDRNLQLLAANRLKSEFVSNMSHEIRTPINAILGFAYLLDRRDLDSDSADLVKKIRNAGHTLLSIINDILDFSKIEAGQLTIESAPLRINDLFERLSDIMAANSANKDLELVIAPVPDSGVQLYGDALRIEQILINLTGNAIKFSSQGVIRVGITLVSKTANYVTMRFSVTDTGIGIPHEKQALIFSAFSQADSSTTRVFGGSGLGLTICRSLVNKMGGEIGVISEPGKGSEFWFTVPFEWRMMAEYAPSAMVRLDVLIVDDSDAALSNLALTARSIGWNVTTAESGDSALLKLCAKLERSSNYDVILIDWKMPGMDGLATAQKMRVALRGKTTTIILMTAAFSREELNSQPNIGAVDGILSKPVTSSSLYNFVVEVARNNGRTNHGGLQRVAAQRVQNLSGIRVLVVDDSDVNCEVAQQIILAEGAIVGLANNGKEAIDWLCKHSDAIDIVLMDVQMPVMDGYEATRQLRAMPQFSTLPIVALTAGAFVEQQDATFKAGMNAFVSKPFDVAELISVIQRLTSGKASTAGVTNQALTWQAGENRDLPGIAIEKALHVWRDEALYHKYLIKFRNDYRDCCEQLDRCFAGGEIEKARALLHKLRGTAGTLSLIDVGRCAIDIERIDSAVGVAKSMAALRDALATVYTSIEKLTAPANGVLQNKSPEPDTAQSDKPAPQLLQNLLDALDSDSPDEANAQIRLMNPAWNPGFMTQLQLCVDNFDFRGAESLVRAMLGKSG